MSDDNKRMLTSSLAVLGRQNGFLHAPEAHEAAKREGAVAWMELYGRPVLQASLEGLVRGRVGTSLANLLSIVSLAPWPATKTLATIFRWTLPFHVKTAMRKFLRRRLRPKTGHVDFGDFRAVRPIGKAFGYERGQPIDRYYIEQFLHLNRGDIYGRVLEIGDSTYTRSFGGDNVRCAESLHVSDPSATYVGDLTSSTHLESEVFDCAIVTQTLQLLFDVNAALANLHRIIKPGGVLLLTVPGTTQISHDEWAETWFWSFTDLSLRKLLGDTFPNARTHVRTYGNVLSSISFLHGLSSTEISRSELDDHDPHYQFLVCARVQKSPTKAAAGIVAP